MGDDDDNKTPRAALMAVLAVTIAHLALQTHLLYNLYIMSSNPTLGCVVQFVSMMIPALVLTSFYIKQSKRLETARFMFVALYLGFVLGFCMGTYKMFPAGDDTMVQQFLMSLTPSGRINAPAGC